VRFGNITTPRCRTMKLKRSRAAEKLERLKSVLVIWNKRVVIGLTSRISDGGPLKREPTVRWSDWLCRTNNQKLFGIRFESSNG